MTKENIKSKKGFTIIEVVLVLAIAGLIFLMVFIGLPALQRSQRDTQRRDDMARFMSQLSQYQANHSGDVPAASTTGYTNFVTDYLKVGNDAFEDPSSGDIYKVVKVADCSEDGECKNYSRTDNAVENSDKLGNITIYTNASCAGEDPTPIQGARKIALTIKLEGAGVYCGHN